MSRVPDPRGQSQSRPSCVSPPTLPLFNVLCIISLEDRLCSPIKLDTPALTAGQHTRSLGRPPHRAEPPERLAVGWAPPRTSTRTKRPAACCRSQITRLKRGKIVPFDNIHNATAHDALIVDCCGATPETKSTAPPRIPTQASERPAIPVMSDPVYCIDRFVGSSAASDWHNRPPLFASAASSSSESAETTGQARMEKILAEILSSFSN
ncbi:hypothetical protein QIS74_01349 [Colletotrichum tabaci]|uniref:Uncharacterized protein n=1 Tax=Colletotrichum tabaci TaxID=1209068 RepID=A0AAV9TRS2_9PEZI